MTITIATTIAKAITRTPVISITISIARRVAASK